ncbi:MAG: right-handed parallel beta-helix repeat-containing protein [bacterium]
MRFLLLVALAAASATPVHARVWPVSDPMKLQEVVDSAAYGDTVMVAPGRYKRVVMRSGVKILSEKGPKETLFKHSTFSLVTADGVDSLATLEGFTIDGLKAAEAGIVHAKESKITLRNCVIQGGWTGVYTEYSDLRVEGCTIRDCQFGLQLIEGGGTVTASDVELCHTGIAIISSNPRILRNTLTRNSLAIRVQDHSDPQIGGTLATANRIWNNPAGAIRNDGLAKREGIRTTQPLTLKVPFNFWGSDCPDSSLFRGTVEWRPWVDESGKRSIEKCTGSPQKKK